MDTPAYSAVIFDFFGTLTKAMGRGPAHDRSALALGCEPAAFADRLNRTYRSRASGHYGDLPTTFRRIAGELGHSPSPAQVTEAVRLKVLAIRDGISLRPDAIRTLWTLRKAGLRIGLISDCTHELPDLVATLPVAQLIDAAVYSIELRATKPHPKLYQTVCRRLFVHPRQCLYIGDGGGRELSGAQAVGMTAVRLDAPDLAGHLVFNREPDWTGASVPALAAVIDLALAHAVREDADVRSATTARYWSHGRAHHTGAACR
jgi:putative hydrolase of the HAD superfamily